MKDNNLFYAGFGLILILIAALAYMVGQKDAAQPAQVIAAPAPSVAQPAPAAVTAQAMTTKPPVAPLPVQAPAITPPKPKVAATPPRRNGPSFDCAKANKLVDNMVCADAGLSALDREMADRYFRARKDPQFGKAHLAVQRDFLRNLGQCTDRDCIYYMYEQRLGELAEYAD